MPSPEHSAPGYLQRVLMSGARPAQLRSSLRALLGCSEKRVFERSTASLLGAFKYASLVPEAEGEAEPASPREWPTVGVEDDLPTPALRSVSPPTRPTRSAAQLVRSEAEPHTSIGDSAAAPVRARDVPTAAGAIPQCVDRMPTPAAESQPFIPLEMPLPPPTATANPARTAIPEIGTRAAVAATDRASTTPHTLDEVPTAPTASMARNVQHSSHPTVRAPDSLATPVIAAAVATNDLVAPSLITSTTSAKAELHATHSAAPLLPASTTSRAPHSVASHSSELVRQSQPSNVPLHEATARTTQTGTATAPTSATQLPSNMQALLPMLGKIRMPGSIESSPKPASEPSGRPAAAVVRRTPPPALRLEPSVATAAIHAYQSIDKLRQAAQSTPERAVPKQSQPSERAPPAPRIIERVVTTQIVRRASSPRAFWERRNLGRPHMRAFR